MVLAKIQTADWSLTKEPKTYDEEKTASSTNVAGKTGYPHVEDKLDLCLAPGIKSTQSWSKTLT
jgi:hypothetical protein